MSNTHGHLPKADRAQLPAALQAGRLEAWTTKAYTDDNLFLTLAQSPGVLEMFLHWAAFMYTGIARLEPSIMELCACGWQRAITACIEVWRAAHR